MSISFNGDFPKIGRTESKELVGFRPRPRLQDTIGIGEHLGNPRPLPELPPEWFIHEEPTPENIEAKRKLNEKMSSTGIKYSDAEKTIKEIRVKYNDDKYFTKEEIDPNPRRDGVGTFFAIDYLPYTVKTFDPNKLPEPARTEYREAIAAKHEIEKNNSALVEKAGCTLNTRFDQYPIILLRILEQLKK